MNRRRHVFLVKPEWDEFRFLELDSPNFDDLGPLMFDGSPVDTRSWRSPPLYVAEPRRRHPDVWGIWSSPALAFYRSHLDELRCIIARSGQVLPLNVPPGDLVVLNVTAVADCLDPASYLMPGVRDRCVFIAHRLPDAPLFKVLDTATVEIFCLEDPDDDELGFKGLYERSGWSGLEFDLVWSEEAGPVEDDVRLKSLRPRDDS